MKIDRNIDEIELGIKRHLAGAKVKIGVHQNDSSTLYSWNAACMSTGELSLSNVTINVMAKNAEFIEHIQDVLQDELPALKLPCSKTKKVEANFQELLKVLHEYAKTEDININGSVFVARGKSKHQEHWESSDLFDAEAPRLPSSEPHVLPIGSTSDVQFLPSDLL